MSSNNPKHLLVFVSAAGVSIYLLNALWSAMFIVAVPMDDNWCSDAVEHRSGEYKSEWRCVEFKNDLERQKYYHNRRMRQRNTYWVYGMVIFGGVLGVVMFHVLPRWRGRDTNVEGFIISIMLGMFVAIVVPNILSWILPAPVEWFPSEITEIAKTRQEEALRRLQEIVNSR